MAVDPELARERMVSEQIQARGIHDAAVLEAMRRIPRHFFVEAALRERAYDDTPLPIGRGVRARLQLFLRRSSALRPSANRDDAMHAPWGGAL